MILQKLDAYTLLILPPAPDTHRPSLVGLIRQMAQSIKRTPDPHLLLRRTQR